MKKYFTEEWRENLVQEKLQNLAMTFGIKELDFNQDNYIAVIEKIHEALTELRVDEIEVKDWEDTETVIF